MRRILVVVFALALVPASAGAGAARPPVALTATPARVLLAGNERTTVRVSNSGTKRVVVDILHAGFALDLRGRPRIVHGSGPHSASGWLSLRPAHLTVGPRSSASLVVAAKLPRHLEPGDYDALALLRTRPLAQNRVAVRLRLGVVVVVRAPGTIVRRLELHALRVARRRGTLEVAVANRGNVTESLKAAQAVLSRAKSGGAVATVPAIRRDLRPRTHGILEFRYRRTLHGPMIARVVIPADGGRSRLQRIYRVRL
jgi:hypothetical protein